MSCLRAITILLRWIAVKPGISPVVIQSILKEATSTPSIENALTWYSQPTMHDDILVTIRSGYNLAPQHLPIPTLTSFVEVVDITSMSHHLEAALIFNNKLFIIRYAAIPSFLIYIVIG